MESIGQISPAEEETHRSSTEVSYADGISKYWLHLGWDILHEYDTVWYNYRLSYVQNGAGEFISQRHNFWPSFSAK